MPSASFAMIRMFLPFLNAATSRLRVSNLGASSRSSIVMSACLAKSLVSGWYGCGAWQQRRFLKKQPDARSLVAASAPTMTRAIKSLCIEESLAIEWRYEEKANGIVQPPNSGNREAGSGRPVAKEVWPC
jgi:hypothetical protein